MYALTGQYPPDDCIPQKCRVGVEKSEMCEEVSEPERTRKEKRTNLGTYGGCGRRSYDSFLWVSSPAVAVGLLLAILAPAHCMQHPIVWLSEPPSDVHPAEPDINHHRPGLKGRGGSRESGGGVPSSDFVFPFWSRVEACLQGGGIAVNE